MDGGEASYIFLYHVGVLSKQKWCFSCSVLCIGTTMMIAPPLQPLPWQPQLDGTIQACASATTEAAQYFGAKKTKKTSAFSQQ